MGGDEVHLTPDRVQAPHDARAQGGPGADHQQLLKEVWGPRYATQTQYLRVYMAQLRNKLERDPARPRFLVTEPGVGYRLKAE